MTRRLLGTLFTLIAFAASAWAEPMAYTGGKSGIWIDPVGGASSGAGTDTLKLGDNSNAGLAYAANPTFTTMSDQPFRLGQITLWNYGASNVPSQATLRVALDFQTPNLGPVNFDFITKLSSNNDGSLSASVDPGSTTNFTGGNGQPEHLKLLGLSSSWDWNNDATSKLTTADCNQASTYIWAEIDHSCDPQVPEPATWALGVIGLGMVAGCRWRMRRRDAVCA